MEYTIERVIGHDCESVSIDYYDEWSEPSFQVGNMIQMIYDSFWSKCTVPIVGVLAAGLK